MAENTQQVTEALRAMSEGTGDFDAVREAVSNATFDPRIPASGPGGDYVTMATSFEDVVTPWTVRRVITRDQWRELRDIWKAQDMPEVVP